MNAPAAAEQLAMSKAADAPQKPARWQRSTVLQVHHWTPEVRSLRITRPDGFRFTPGHYVRLGLEDATGEAVWRPFSMVSGRDEAELEFLTLVVPEGPFSERLRTVVNGSTMLVENFGLGFLTLDQLAAGRDLWLLASGTGIGPFISILRTPALCERFEQIILVHSVRQASELTYRDEITHLGGSPTFAGRLHYIPVVTRETMLDTLKARIPALLEQSVLQAHAGVDLDRLHSRVMVCGNPDLTRDMRGYLSARGFQSSRRGVAGQMAFEKYW